MSDQGKDFVLGPWLVQPASGCLSDGNLTHHLEPKQMSILVFLAQHAGEVVPKDAVLARVWPDTHVSASGLTRNISHLRKALGDNTHQPQFILTIPKRGYQLLMQPLPLPAKQVALSSTNSWEGDDKREMGSMENLTKVPTQMAIDAGSPDLLNPPRMKWGRLSAIAFFFLGVSVTGLYFNAWGDPKSQAVGPTNTEETLAVLPLINRSQDPDTDFFADGLTEELIDLLGRQEGMKVVARTSSFAFRGKALDVRSIGKSLNVAKILEGSVSRRQDRLRVTVRLVDSHTGYQLWSQTYERQAEDVFRVQLDIATTVAQQMKIATKAEAVMSAGRTANTVAYDYYLKGQYWCHKGDVRNFPTAIDFFQRAVDTDPSYARAFSSLARTWTLLGQSGLTGNRQWLDHAQSAAQKALALDAGQDEAYATLGMIAMYRNQSWVNAETEIQKAIAINPSNPLNYIWYAQVLMASGRTQEAAAKADQGIMYDPFNPYAHYYSAFVFMHAELFEKAQTSLDKIRALLPQFVPAKVLAVRLAQYRGDWQGALEACKNFDPDEVLFASLYACTYANLGQLDKADVIQGQLTAARMSGNPISAFELALIHAAMNQYDHAFNWLEVAMEEHDPTLILELATHPMLDSLRQDPRFEALSKWMGL